MAGGQNELSPIEGQCGASASIHWGGPPQCTVGKQAKRHSLKLGQGRVSIPPAHLPRGGLAGCDSGLPSLPPHL